MSEIVHYSEVSNKQGKGKILIWINLLINLINFSLIEKKNSPREHSTDPYQVKFMLICSIDHFPGAYLEHYQISKRKILTEIISSFSR